MTLQQLEYFLEAARTLSFTKTAETFYISQSAVTQQIRNLEEELGVTLFNRKNNRITLTPAGSLFAKESKAIIAKTRDVIQKVRAVHNGLSGSLNIGYLNAMEMNQFPKTVQMFHNKYPSIKLNLFRGSMYGLHDKLMDGSLDLIFNIDNDNLKYPNGVINMLKHHGYSVVVPRTHPLASKRQVLQEDLGHEQLIVHNMHREESASPDPMPRKFLKDELLDNIIATERDVETIMIMVAAGIGIAVLPDFDVRKLNNDLDIKAIPLDTNGYQATVSEYHLKTNMNPLVQLFVDELIG